MDKDYTINPGQLREEELRAFLCGERGFSPDRVETLIDRMKAAGRQRSLSDYLGGA